MEQYCMYLRKSRSDAEAELRGEGETLARHEKILVDLAKYHQFNVTKMYKEIVSGETIAARPVMQELLAEVEQGIWTGVLVVEVERLARGNTIDQGIISQTFKFTNTKIVTPTKIYDPSNEFDEEYFEFGLFMSRREYKTINRRLQQGRMASVKEGKFVNSVAPYGYVRKKLENQKGWTLEPHPEQADIVKLIFEWYTVGVANENGKLKRIGVSLIVRKLNEMGVKSAKGGVWVNASIQDILINPVYMGKIRWNWRKTKKSMVDGSLAVSRKRADLDDCLLFDGLHEPLISEETYYKARDLRNNNRANPVARSKEVQNPLSGLVVCGVCGRKMQRRPYKKKGQAATLMCSVTSCDNVSSQLHLVEERIMDSLQSWLTNKKLAWEEEQKSNAPKLKDVNESTLATLDKEIDKLKLQLANMHNLLEQGVYSIAVFQERNEVVTKELDTLENQKKAVLTEIEKEHLLEQNRSLILPKVEHVLNVYDSLDNAGAKNELLKDVLEKVVYTKSKDARWGNMDDFQIVIHPKNPLK